MSEEHSPWMCHICDHRSSVGAGLVCSQCYKITCREHITTTSVYNPDSGLYELKLVCTACHFINHL